MALHADVLQCADLLLHANPLMLSFRMHLCVYTLVIDALMR